MQATRRVPIHSPATKGLNLLADLIRVMRPRQWSKNLVCLAALVFSGNLVNPEAIPVALLGFACFCFASSAVYVINDICDAESDRAHPTKRLRPIASGGLTKRSAWIEAGILVSVALGLSLSLGIGFYLLMGTYLVFNLLYSFGMKQIPILDVMTIAFGFVLRVQSGIEAIGAPASAWVLICIFFLALFLALGKRRGEITATTSNGTKTVRGVLHSYTLGFLDVMLGLCATTSLVCYSLYVVTVQPSKAFLLTILPVAFGIFRYMHLLLVQGDGESPDEMLTRDVPLITAIFVWAFLCIAVLYFGARLFSDLPS